MVGSPFLLLYCTLFGEFSFSLREGIFLSYREWWYMEDVHSAITVPWKWTFMSMKQILLDFRNSGACALIASHLSTAILSWVQHQIAVGLACGSKNDAGRPEEGRALL